MKSKDTIGDLPFRPTPVPNQTGFGSQRSNDQIQDHIHDNKFEGNVPASSADPNILSEYPQLRLARNFSIKVPKDSQPFP